MTSSGDARAGRPVSSARFFPTSKYCALNPTGYNSAAAPALAPPMTMAIGIIVLVCILLLALAAAIAVGVLPFGKNGGPPVTPGNGQPANQPAGPPAPTTGQATLVRAYLKQVYVMTDWAQYSDAKVEQIYDALGFFFNCCSHYWGKDLQAPPGVGTTWNPLACCAGQRWWLRAPKGWFMSFNQYNALNQAVSYSNGTGLLADWGTYRNTMHSAMGNLTELGPKTRSGPGPLFVTPYSLQRDMAHPNGISFGGTRGAGTWTIRCRMGKDLPNYGLALDAYGRAWASQGLKKGDYIEVVHLESAPGMAQSIGYWFNGFPSGGTGIFLRLGETRVSTNKFGGMVLLLEELAGRSAANLAQLHGAAWPEKYRGMSGEQILHKEWGTSDAYVITFKLSAGWNPTWGQQWGFPFNNSWTAELTPLIYANTGSWTVIPNSGILGASGLMRGPQDMRLSGDDGHGYIPSSTYFSDTAIWWLTQTDGHPPKLISGPGNARALSAADMKRVITACIYPGKDIDYFPNRGGATMTLDEPLCWLGFMNGVESIQSTLSANVNGLWYYEIIDLRLPGAAEGLSAAYSTGVKKMLLQRVYPFIHQSGNPGGYAGAWDPVYNAAWHDSLRHILSLRDPLAPQNAKTARNCSNTGWDRIGPPKSDAECVANPFPTVPDPPGMTNQFHGFPSGGKCWTGLDQYGWWGLPCDPEALSYQWTKVGLTAGPTIPWE